MNTKRKLSEKTKTSLMLYMSLIMFTTVLFKECNKKSEKNEHKIYPADYIIKPFNTDSNLVWLVISPMVRFNKVIVVTTAPKQFVDSLTTRFINDVKYYRFSDYTIKKYYTHKNKPCTDIFRETTFCKHTTNIK